MKQVNARMRFVLIAIISLLGMIASAQDKTPSVNPYNVPDEVRACLRQHPDVHINADVNPFIVSGKFDGDDVTDFAIQVTNEKGARGVLFCLSSGHTAVWGAGVQNAILKIKEWPFDSWLLMPKGGRHLRNYKFIRWDAVALIIADEGGGLVYWDGSQLRWKQEE
jgi:hypothetical protein